MGAIDLNRLLVKIDAQTDDLEVGLKRTEGEVKSWITGVRGFLSEAGANIVGNLVTPMIQGLGTWAGEAFQVVSGHERLGASLQAMLAKEINASQGLNDLKEAAKRAIAPAAELTKWIQQVAIKSPFSKEGVALSIQQAMAFGFTSSEAKKMTQTLIDWASGAGKSEDSMQRVALVLGQIRAKGKLTGEELMQLTEAGIGQGDVFNEMARITGKSTEQLQKMVSKGLIPADLAIKAVTQSLDRDFKGAAEAQSGTLEGVANSLGDLRQEFLRLAFTPFFQTLQPHLNKFAETLQDPKIQEAVANLGRWLGDMTGKGVSQLLDLGKTVERVFSSLRQTSGMGAGTRTFGVLTALGLDDNTARVVGGAVDLIAGGLRRLQDAAVFVRQHIEAFNMVFAVLLSLLVGRQVSAGLAGLIEGFMKLPGMVMKGVEAIRSFNLSLSLLGGPVGLVVALVTFLALAWLNNWFNMREHTAKAVEFIQGVIRQGLTLIQAWWTQHGEQVKAVAYALWLFVSGHFLEGINAVKNLVMVGLLALALWWMQHGEQVKAIAQGVWNVLKALFDLGLANLKSLFLAFKAAYEGDWRGFGSNLRDIWDRTWEAIKVAIRVAGPLIVQGAKSLADEVARKFREIDWAEVGKDIVRGIGRGLSSMMGWLKEKARSVAEAAKEAAKGLLRIESPSKVMAEEVGVPFVQGIGVGIEKGIMGVRNAIRSVVDDMVDTATVSVKGQEAATSTVVVSGATAGGRQPTIGSITITGNTFRNQDDIDTLMRQLQDRLGVQGVRLGAAY